METRTEDQIEIAIVSDMSASHSSNINNKNILPAVFDSSKPEVGTSDLGDNKIHPIEKTNTMTNDKPAPVTIEFDNDIDTEATQRQKHRREATPLLYCKIVTKWPLRCFVAALCGHILMIVISVILLISGYDLLPVDFENLPLEINDLPWRPRDLAFRQRDDFPEYYERVSGATNYRNKEYSRANIDMYYDGDGGNVFTKEVLETIQMYETTLMSVPEYNTTYCKLNTQATACEHPISIIRFFDGTYASISPVFNDPNFDNITGVIYEANTNNATRGAFQFFLAKGYSISQTAVFNPITRSKLLFGYPLQAYDTAADYEKAARKFQSDQMKPILHNIYKNAPYICFSYRSDVLWIEDVFNQAMKDVMCAIGSICFIFVFILIHTRSVWITSFAVLSILTCFLCTNLIYVVVLDFRYIGFFHVLTLFIVLGIGADDIFVFFDVWRNTAYEPYPSLAHRLSDAYRRSVKSMFFTSITTSTAFFASAISPLLATRSFGVFSGLVIIVNYISVIVYFPTVVVMYHTRFEKYRWPCLKICKKSKEEQNKEMKREVSSTSFEKDPCVYIADFSQTKDNSRDVYQTKLDHESTISNGHGPTNSKNGILNGIGKEKSAISLQEKNNANGTLKNGFLNGGFIYNEKSQSSPANEMQIQEQSPYMRPKEKKRKSRIVKFFRHTYSGIVTHRIGRWIILAFTAGVLGFFISQAVKLEPDNEGLKVLRDSHVYSIAAEHATSSFIQSNADRTLEIYIVWGFHENDMSNCHFSTPKCQGVQRWDTSFNPSSVEAQQAVMDFCDTMKNFPADVGNAYRIKTDIVTGEYNIDCFMHSLSAFLDDENTAYGTNWNLPFNYTESIALMDANPTYYNSTGFNNTYTHFLEIPISHWLSNRQTYVTTDDYETYEPLIGEEIGTFSRGLNNDSTKKYGNNIKYVTIKVRTTLVVANLGFTEGLPVKDKWENFVSTEMAKMPEGMKNGFQTTFQIWHWLHVQEMLAQNAVYGIVIGVCLAFPILTIATMNIITGALATFSMCCSTVCVIGVIPLGGWKLGVLESLNMCMVVGLTVDYVVHLAEGYTLSLHKQRLFRVQDMLEEMAISIFFGACTTLGASMFMFIAQLSFFFQFGIFMFSTILFSLFFSMGMFVTLMGLLGPQHDVGNLRVLFRKLKNKCTSGQSA